MLEGKEGKGREGKGRDRTGNGGRASVPSKMTREVTWWDLYTTRPHASTPPVPAFASLPLVCQAHLVSRAQSQVYRENRN